MRPPLNLQKIGALIIVIPGGIPGAIAVYMGIAEREYFLGIHLFVFVFAMAFIFQIGAIIIAMGLLKDKK